MKAIQLLVNQALPEELRNYSRTMDSTSIGALMAEVARKHPEQYEGVAKTISDLGRKASYLQGETLTLSDMEPVFDRQALYATMDKELQELKKNSKNDEEFKQKRLGVWSKYGDIIKATTVKEALKRNSNLAYSVVSGARGSPDQLKMMVSTPALYTDSNDDIVPIFIRNSFGDGLRPAEYLAGTYGARKSVLCLYEATLVRMADGSAMPINQIRVGMMVLGADKNGNTFPVKVTNVFDQGIQPVNKYIFRRGIGEGRHEVICTPSHKFLQNDYRAYQSAYSSWHRKYSTEKPATQLLHKMEVYPVGDKRPRQCAVLAGPITSFDGYDEPYALLLGILTGDGCLTDKNVRLRLSCADESMIADLSSSIGHLNLKITDQRCANFDWEIVSKNYSAGMNLSIQTGIHGFVAGARMPHKQIIVDEGLAGCRAESKSLPVNINKWSNKSVLDYIAGLIATDGSIYFDTASGMPRVSFAMTAKNVIFDLHKLLRHRFGVYATEISFRDKGGFRDKNSLRKNRLWEFSVTTDTSIKRLLTNMPAIPGVKEALRQKALTFKLKQENPYPKAKLEFITDMGMLPCYDIEVDHPDHLFVLDVGIISSNSTKRATARGGDLAKQAVQSAVNIIVTTRDCGVKNGIDLDIDDSSLRNRILGKAQGDLPAGTVLDKQAIARLRSKGIKHVIARSVLTCQAKNGVCAKCVGLNPKGEYEDIGSAIGVTSAQAIGEPITQSALNTKHQGGVATGKKVYSGFDVINRFVQTPEVFPDRAVVAEQDGKIDKIAEAPQGGFYVNVNAQKHYVPPGYPLNVKVGDSIEAGEPLSEGLISPGDIVRLRGVGEGRKYYADRLKQILDDSGMKADRRNTEMLARAALDHVRVLDAEPEDNYLPDDIVSYNYMAQNYTPPEDTKALTPSNAVGKYLQAPILHYTIGTRITPKIAKHIESVDPNPVHVSGTGPQFEPDMIRLRTAAHSSRDWLASMHTSYLKSQIAESATRGDDTNVRENTHFAPRLAIGEGFGTNIKTTGKF